MLIRPRFKVCATLSKYLYEQSKKGEEARRKKIEQEREIGQIVRIEGISETEKTSEE